ncbi:uro-adherence factor A-like isoform X2 [Heptranchias perlo]|uniref:uro-adherence factor A-like isoform X2 n=1 Tax=Heptranchias perlo TaxID=212740 RepID=UPI00355AB357
MDNKDLRGELLSLGYTAGPITDSTRSLYIKKLNQLREEKRRKEPSSQAPQSRHSLKQPEVHSLPPVYSEQLRKRPSAASATKAYLTHAWQSPEDQADGVSADDPLTDYTGTTADDFADRLHTGKSVSVNDGYTGKSGSLYSDRKTGKSDNLYSDQYTGKSDNLYSDRYTGTYQSLNSDRHTGKSDSLYSDRYTGKSDSLYSDRYTGKSDNLYSDRYTGKYQSLNLDRYPGTSDSLYSDRYTGKYQSLNSDPYTKKSDSLYSDRYVGKSDSLYSDRNAGRFSNLYTERCTRNSGSLYSDGHYRGKSDSLYENERYASRTPAGLPKRVQKDKSRRDKFEFYLSRFLFASTIVLCLVLMGLVCVKTLGLVEGSQEDIGENIKMLPVDCSGKTDAFCQAEEHKIIMTILFELHEYLAETAGEFECGAESTLKSKCVPITEVERHFVILHVPHVEKFNKALQWIIQSTRDFGIRLVGEHSEAAITSVDQVTCLESTRPQMNLYCRLSHALFIILNRMLIFILGFCLCTLAAAFTNKTTVSL